MSFFLIVQINLRLAEVDVSSQELWPPSHEDGHLRNTKKEESTLS